jgi:BASS family bile acid:Na+ symporter
MALVAAFWGVWHLISAFVLSMWWQFRPIAAALGKERAN